MRKKRTKVRKIQAPPRMPGKQGTRLLKAMARFLREHGFMPSFREMAVMLGYPGQTNIVQHVLAELKRKGFVATLPGKAARGTYLLGGRGQLVFADSEAGRLLAAALGEEVGSWSS
jgi:hypothetical protein